MDFLIQDMIALDFKGYDEGSRKIQELVGKDARILDIGCGSGLLGKKVRPSASMLGVKKNLLFLIVNKFLQTFTDDIQIVVIHSRGVYNFMGINLVP